MRFSEERTFGDALLDAPDLIRAFLSDILNLDIHSVQRHIGKLFVIFWSIYFLIGPELFVPDLFMYVFDVFFDVFEEYLLIGIIIFVLFLNAR